MRPSDMHPPPRAVLVLGLLACLVGAAPTTHALDPDRAVTQYVRDVWDRNDGLPTDSVTAITQTRDGYLWVGTTEGLARFDGVRFQVYDSSNVDALVNDYIWSLFEDREGRLWIGTREGLVSYHQGAFTRHGMEEGLPAEPIHRSFEDSDGRLWVALTAGVHVRDDGRFRVFESPEYGPLEHVVAIGQGPDGALWFLSTRHIYRLLDGDLSEHSTPANQADFRPSNANIVDYLGRVWIGAPGMVCVLQEGESRCLEHGGVLLDRQPSGMVLDRSGSLWIGTLTGGLFRFRDRTWERLSGGGGVADDQVQALYGDREGNLWVGTNGAGLARLRDGKFLSYSRAEGLSSEFAHSIYEDRFGAIWVGTSGGGLNRLADGRVDVYTSRDGLPNDDVLTTVEDAAGTLWIGTGGGLARLAGGRIRQVGSESGFTAPVVFSSVTGPDGSVVLGTLGTVVRYSEGSFETLLQFDPRVPIAALSYGRAGTLWAGVFGRGLIRVSGEGETIYDTGNGLPSNDVISLLVDPDGTVWIGTYGGGLTRYRDGTFTTYDRRVGLHSDVVYQILPDDHDNLWMGSNDGVFRVARKDLDAYADGRSDSIRCVVYDARDGMRSPECNGGQQPAGWRSRDGRLWFPTTDGVAVIDPARLVTNRQAPPVHIEEVLVGEDTLDGSADPGGPPRLPPGSGNLEFRYTAPSLRSAEKVRFRYRLDGLDDDWTDAGARRTAYYTNVPPGEYTFRVTACNDDGVWNATGTSFRFSLAPRFYQSAWFWVLGFATLCFVALGGHRLRVRRLKTREEKLSAVVSERTHDLAEAKRELEESNRTLERRVQEGIDALRDSERMAAYGNMVASVAHEVRHPIFSLQAAAYVLGDKLSERTELRPQLRVLDRETKRMTELMNDLLEFARPGELNEEEVDPVRILVDAEEACRLPGESESGPPIDARADGELPRIAVDRRRLVQVLVNLVENAQRHAEGATRIELRATGTSGGVAFSVSDDGAGIPEDRLPHVFEPFYTGGKGTGLGLAIARRFVHDHGGAIRVHSRQGQGTTFTVEIPVSGSG